MCLFLCQCHTVFVTVALLYCPQYGRVMPPASFFFLRIALAILGLLWFHINFSIVYSSSLKTVKDHIKSVDYSGSMAILTILVLPTQEHGVSFHFFDASLVSFINVLYFSACKSSTSLVRFVSRYFIFWHDFKRDFFFNFLFLMFHC